MLLVLLWLRLLLSLGSITVVVELVVVGVLSSVVVVVVVFCGVVGTNVGAFGDSCWSWKRSLPPNSLFGLWLFGIKSVLLSEFVVVHCVLSLSSLLLLNTCVTAHADFDWSTDADAEVMVVSAVVTVSSCCSQYIFTHCLYCMGFCKFCR